MQTVDIADLVAQLQANEITLEQFLQTFGERRQAAAKAHPCDCLWCAPMAPGKDADPIVRSVVEAFKEGATSVRLIVK